MTTTQWEQAAGHVHEIKGIEAKIKQVKAAVGLSQIADCALLDSDTREACRELIVAMLEGRKSTIEKKLDAL